MIHQLLLLQLTALQSGSVIAPTPVDYHPPYSFSSNYVRARYFSPEYLEAAGPSAGPRLRGLIPGRFPGTNSGLLF